MTQTTPQTSSSDSKSATRRDLRQEITATITEMLERGTTPWQKPWKPGQLEMPLNPTTAKSYRGGNAIYLMARGIQKGYDDPRWLTYKQANRQGWQVRKGESGAQIEYWEFPGEPSDRDPAPRRPEQSERATAPIHRVYTVFNANQVDGIEPYQPKVRPDWEVVQSGEAIVRNSGAIVLHDQDDRAFYSRALDRIHLPQKGAFPSAADYYGTVLHELGHWSGHEQRLNRDTLTESYRFGDTNYAKEELRAELTSVFLAAELGIPHDTGRHAAYVESWIQVLKSDKNELFRAAREANRAADFILALERETSVEKALGVTEGKRVSQNEPPIESSGSHQPHQGPSNRPLDSSFDAAKAMSKRALGEHARVYQAQTDSGIYRGKIIGETDHHLVQKISSSSAVAHIKHLMGRQLNVGDNVILRYSDSSVEIGAFQPKGLSKELTR